MGNAFPHWTGSRGVIVMLFSLVALTLAGSPSRAEEPLESPNITIGGFIAYSYTFNNDLTEFPSLGPSNFSERNFDLRGELDIGARWDWASARFDLNFPSDGNEEVGINQGDPDANIGIEQARFDLTPKFGQDIDLTLTGGLFNAPIGLQHQDPDQQDSITDGLQFLMMPRNLLGIDISGGNEQVRIGAIVANEWHADADEQLTFGAHGKLMLDKFTLSVGGLFTTDAIGDNYVVNGIASTTAIPWIKLDLEGTVDDHNLGVGTSVRIARPEHQQCGAVLRYERVWAQANSDFMLRYAFTYPILLLELPGVVSDDHNIDLLSLTLFTEMMRDFRLQTEGRATKVDEDAPGGVDETYYSLVARVTYSF